MPDASGPAEAQGREHRYLVSEREDAGERSVRPHDHMGDHVFVTLRLDDDILDQPERSTVRVGQGAAKQAFESEILTHAPGILRMMRSRTQRSQRSAGLRADSTSTLMSTPILRTWRQGMRAGCPSPPSFRSAHRASPR